MEKLEISVLLVEDDSMSRILYSKFLKRIVSTVYTAEDGIDGIEIFKSHKPDLIISDIKMPRMDGLEMIQELKKIDESIKVILVSGHQETDYFIKSIELGVSGYLLKPIDQKHLVRIIRETGNTILLNRKVRETEKRFKELAELLPEIVFEADLEGRLIFINKQALEMLKYSENDLDAGLTIHRLILPELNSMEQIDKLLNDAGTKDFNEEMEIRVRTKKGKTFPALMYASTIYKNDKPVGIRGVMVNISTQKNTENELRRNQQTIERILQSSPDPIIVTNLDNEIIKYNQAGMDLFNRTRIDDPFGKTLLAVVSDDQRDQLKKDYEQVKKKDFLKNIEYKLLDENGSEIFTEISMSVIRNQEGNPDLIVGIIKDITERKNMIRELQQLNLDLEGKVMERTRRLTNEIEERKQVEIALIESQERHSALSKAAFEGIIISESNCCLEANQAAVEMFGYNIHEFTRMDILDLFVTDLRVKREDFYQKDQEKPLEITAITKEKKKFSAEVQWKKYRYKGRDVWVTAIRDISQRKYAEKLLKQRMSFIELVNKTSSEFIRMDNIEIDQGIEIALKDVTKFTHTERGYVYQINPESSLYQLTHEWSRKKLAPRKETLPEIAVKAFSSKHKLLENGEKIIMTKDEIDGSDLSTPLKKKFKNIHFEKTILIPMFIGRSLTGFYGFDTTKKDFTWDDELINAYEITGQIIANAIQRKKYDEELIKAKEKAEESDKSKSVFLANVSHEIQTPIKAIISFSNMLRSPDPGQKRRAEFINIINSNSLALLNLTNDILEFTRIQSNIIKLFRINFELNLFLDELYMVFNSQKEKKGRENLELRLSIPDKDTPCMINSDPSRLKQIFSNLIGNAFKFTSKGYVEYGYRFTKKDSIEFFVRDTGMGISKKYQKLIFDRFIQEPKPMNIKKEGTGLGLAITHSLIKLLGGTIWVESETGKGSAFYFEIPGIASTGEKNDDKHVWQDKQVILVEDIIQDYIFIEEILKSRVRLYYVGDCQQANELCKSNPELSMILISLSVLRKEKDGFLKNMRRQNPHLVIIGMADNDEQLAEKKGLFNELDDIIYKPPEKEVLLPILEKYLGEK
ncbi:MAG: PAS domain S-box protein [Bacteroidales bacterium]